MSRTIDMTVGSPTKHILLFSLPLILTNLGQQLYMIVDAAIVGRGVGVMALAAVGATDWCYWLILWTLIGMTQGFGTFVSRFFGDKNYTAVNKAIAMSTLLCAAVGTLMTLLGIFTARPLLLLLNTPSDILDGATVYLIVLSAGTPIVTAYNMAASILRAFGDGKTPLLAMVIAAVLNIGLDCLFVLLFQWGILGAAVASVLSQLVAFLFCFLRIRSIECVHPDREAWRPDWHLIRSMMTFALPLALEHVVIALGGIFLQSSVNLQGSVFIAGYTATNKVYGLIECSAISVGLASSTFLAQNYGARLYPRVRHGANVAALIVLLMSVVVAIPFLLFRREILQLFLDVRQAGGAEALEIAARYLTVMVLFLAVLYLIHVYRNALQAMEISVWSMISGAAECVCRVFMAKVAIHWSFLGSDALFVSEPVAWLAALLLVMIPYYFYYRRKLL